MSVVTPESLVADPTIATALTNYAAGLASGFLTALNARQDEIEDRYQRAQGNLEQLGIALAYGGLSGGAITAGVGLSASVAALTALVGGYVGTDAAITVGDLAPNDVSYLWLRQDGTFTANVTGTVPSGDTHGAALLWGTVTTDGSSVTAVDNDRVWFSPQTVRDRIETSSALRVGRYHQYNVHRALTCYGTMRIEGTLLVHGWA